MSVHFLAHTWWLVRWCCALELALVSPTFCLDVYMKTVQFQSHAVYVCAHTIAVSYNSTVTV